MLVNRPRKVPTHACLLRTAAGCYGRTQRWLKKERNKNNNDVNKQRRVGVPVDSGVYSESRLPRQGMAWRQPVAVGESAVSRPSNVPFRPKDRTTRRRVTHKLNMTFLTATTRIDADFLDILYQPLSSSVKSTDQQPLRTQSW